MARKLTETSSKFQAPSSREIPNRKLQNCSRKFYGRLEFGAFQSAPQFFISRRVILRHDAFMGKRREARERSVQFLFKHDLNPPDNLELELSTFWNSQRAAAIEDEKSGHAKWGEVTELPPPTVDETELRLFSEPLIKGVLEHRDAIDEHIKKHAKNWDFHRIAA